MKILRALLFCSALAAAAQTAPAQCLSPGFDAAFNMSTGRRVMEVAVGDFNGDGRADVAAPDSNSQQIFIMLGTATGVPTVTTITSVLGAERVVAADFNKDTKLDLAVTLPVPHGRAVAVLLGDGAGGFGEPIVTPAQQARPLVVADFNGDTNPDLFIGNTSTNVSQVLLGNGSGGFTSSVMAVVPNNASAAAGDFNSDNKVDLAVTSDGGTLVHVAFGDGAGGFGSSNSFSVPGSNSVAVGDLNGDSKLDLIVTGQADGVSVLLGNGAGNFGAATPFATGFQAVAATVGDFDGDGKADIFAAGNSAAAVLRGDGAGNFTSLGKYPVSQPPLDAVAGDFDGDGRLDAATANHFSSSFPPLDGQVPPDTVTFFLGEGDGRLRSATVLDTPANAFFVTGGDLNGDASDDLVFIGQSDNVWVRLSDGAGGFAAAVGLPAGSQPGSAVVGDVTGDGRADIVSVNNANTLAVFPGDGAGGFGAATQTALPGSTPRHVSLGDFNNDGRTDAAVAYFNSSFVTVLRGNGSGGFLAPVNSQAQSSIQHGAAHDFNGDGNADLALAAIGAVVVLPGNGAGGFGAASTLAINLVGGVSSVAAGDFDGDGRADIAAVGPNLDSVTVFRGDGAGNFAPPAAHPTDDGPTAVAVADFDGDGDDDIATANSSGTVSVLRGDGAGGFAAASNFVVAAITAPGGIAVGDFDSDGRPDIATANRGGNLIAGFNPPPGTLSVLFNTCAAAPAAPPTLSVGDVVVNEGDSGVAQATFTVTLSSASTETVSVGIYAAGQDAARHLDFQAAAGRLLFAPGETTKTFSVPVVGDAADEFDEKFAVILALPLNAAVADGLGLGTITDDDPPPSIAVGDLSFAEGDSSSKSVTFTVSLSAASGKTVTVAFATADGTAHSSGPNADYAATNGVLEFSPGQTSLIVNVTVVSDLLAEPDETFALNLSAPTNATLADAQGSATILNDDTNIQFETGTLAVNESGGVAVVRVTRTGLLGAEHLVTYATNDGTASERSDYNLAVGTLRFAPGEAEKEIRVFVTNDSLVEGPETFRIDLLAFSPGTMGSPTRVNVTIASDDEAQGPNPVDTSTEFFVRQHYRDFLGRDPDANGLAFWVNQIEECGADAQCREVRRINVSAAFYLSIEFQETGYLVYRLRQAAFDSGERVPLRSFAADMAAIRDGVIVGVGDWAQRLEANKRAFIEEFVRRQEFTQLFPGTMTAEQFVAALDANTYDPLTPSSGGSLTQEERQQLASALASGAMTRAEVLRAVAENQTFHRRQFNKAFVLMQYFGYLRRNPNDPPDTGFGGFNFWLGKLNEFQGNFINAEMVKAFITSLEYRARFGPT